MQWNIFRLYSIKKIYIPKFINLGLENVDIFKEYSNIITVYCEQNLKANIYFSEYFSHIKREYTTFFSINGKVVPSKFYGDINLDSKIDKRDDEVAMQLLLMTNSENDVYNVMTNNPTVIQKEITDFNTVLSKNYNNQDEIFSELSARLDVDGDNIFSWSDAAYILEKANSTDKNNYRFPIELK